MCFFRSNRLQLEGVLCGQTDTECMACMGTYVLASFSHLDGRILRPGMFPECLVP